MTAFRQGDYGSAEAGADLSAKQYYIVKTDSNGHVVLASDANDAIIGVLANAPKQGETADVALINGSGSFKVVTGDDVTKDAYLTTDSNGKAIATTTAKDQVIGRALTAGTSGDVVEYIKHNELYNA